MQLHKPIPARALIMDGTMVDSRGLPDILANRAVNVESGLPSIVKDRELKGRAAIVGYGPSLASTWERLRDFETIWTVSGAHDFLLARGIRPTHHLDVDPRKHKGEFIRDPQQGVHYFLSTHSHPTYVQKMKAAGADVRLFHVAIDPKQKLDPRYMAHKVRYDAGIQAAEVAFQHGHREQHWFGIDYSREGPQTHAGAHWGVTSLQCEVEACGRVFGCTQLFFHGLMMAEEFLCDRALVRCTLHGDGLLRHFLRDRGRTKFSVVP